MTKGITVKRQFHVRCGRSNRRKVLHDAKADSQFHRVPRISRLMAMAIKFDQLIRDGVIADQAQLAQLGRVSRARLTQIMNLLNLAPDIQDAILHLPATKSGRESVSKRTLRPVAAVSSWRDERRMWR